MRLRALILMLLIPSVAFAQAQGWQADQDGDNFTLSNVNSVQVNSLAGVGTSCVQADNNGLLSVTGSACGAGGGGVSSVTGTAAHISATPTTGAVIVDLIATAVTPGSYIYASFTVDAYGRLTAASSGATPVTSVGVTAPITTTGGTTPTIGISLPAGQIAYGNGGNVVSVADQTFDAATDIQLISNPNLGGTATYWVTAGAGTNGGGFFRGYGSAFVVPSLADHVGFGNDTGGGSQGIVVFGNSVSPSGGGGSISLRGGGYDTVAENILYDVNGSHFTDGNIYVTEISTPATPSAGIARFFASTSGNVASVSPAGIVNHGAQTQTAAAGKAFTALSAAGAFTETSFQTPITWPAATDVLVSSGTSTVPVGDSHYTYDTSLHVQAGGDAVGVNGVSVPNNDSLCVGHTTNSDRDRVQFFVGGGTLGGGGTSDSTLVDIIPSSTTIAGGVTAGIYATERVRAVTYSGASALTEATSLYIDAAPTLGGGVSSTAMALHVASGQAQFGGNITSTLLTAGGAIAVDTLGTFGIAGVGGLPPAISAETPYYITVAGSTLVTGASVWLATSSTAGAGAAAIEYPHAFAASRVALEIRFTNNAITAGSFAAAITRNGSNFSTLALTSSSTGTVSTGTVSVGSPAIGDRWGVAVGGTGTTMSGNMVFTATLMLAPNVF